MFVEGMLPTARKRLVTIGVDAPLIDAAKLRGGLGFSDRGISGFLAGHNRRNEVHEEAQT